MKPLTLREAADGAIGANETQREAIRRWADEADAAQKRIGELEAALAACKDKGTAAALDAFTLILDERTKAFTEGHAAGMQAAYDGEVTNAALSQARADERKRIETAVSELARMVPVGGDEMETSADDNDPDGWWAAEDVLDAIRALLPDSAPKGESDAK